MSARFSLWFSRTLAACSLMICLYTCGAALPGCGASLTDLEDSEYKTLADKLSKCRAEARASLQTSSSPQSKQAAEAAYYVYESCKIREGVSGADGGAP